MAACGLKLLRHLGAFHFQGALFLLHGTKHIVKFVAIFVIELRHFPHEALGLGLLVIDSPFDLRQPDRQRAGQVIALEEATIEREVEHRIERRFLENA
ncbi:hypothetical protein DM480_03600 [Sphingomonas sp. FARSPH]|nr:hypothetical protein DM480_03600 [Sphingomonas sp. FARSPH]